MSVKRRIDAIGRLCLPVEYRKQLGMGEECSVEIDIQNDSYLIIRPTNDDMTTKIKLRIKKFEKQLLRGSLSERERIQIQYALKVLKDLL